MICMIGVLGKLVGGVGTSPVTRTSASMVVQSIFNAATDVNVKMSIVLPCRKSSWSPVGERGVAASPESADGLGGAGKIG